MANKIALEEHFLCPGFEDYWKATVADVDPNILKQVVGRLSDFGEQRLKSMDSAGIVRAVLGLTGPGVQAERDTATAIRKARAANDFLAAEVQKRPDRYSGFAHRRALLSDSGVPRSDVALAGSIARCCPGPGLTCSGPG